MDARHFIERLDAQTYGEFPHGAGGRVERAMRGDGLAVAYGVGQAVIVVEAFDAASPEPGSDEYARRAYLAHVDHIHGPLPASFNPLVVMSLSPREEGMSIGRHAELGVRPGRPLDGATNQSTTFLGEPNIRHLYEATINLGGMLRLWAIATGKPVEAGAYEKDNRGVIDYMRDPYGLGPIGEAETAC